MSGGLRVAPEVATALEEGAPVVALESALVTHGFARPANLAIARRMAIVAREAGALPAFVAVLDGEAHIGLSNIELARLAAEHDAWKISLRDLPVAEAQQATGGTTVAATLHLAHLAGLQVFATGGIGGVHRGHPEDISGDLPALSRLPLVVVCAGAKAILDLPRTLEYLETWGVPVIGYSTAEFPAFYSRSSGLGLSARVDTPEEVARIASARANLRLQTATLVCVPAPEDEALDPQMAERAIRQASESAEAAGVSGKHLTPYLLAQVVALTGGQAQRANEALLVNNVRIAARIARVLADDSSPTG